MSQYLSGLDEAGYGPMLGPLVVGLATIESHRPMTPDLPWTALAPAAGPPTRDRKGIAVADSKRLHRPSTGDLTGLEEGVLAFCSIERGGPPPETFRALIDHLTAGRSDYLQDYPWYRDADLPLPHSADPLALASKTRKLERALERAGMKVSELRAIPLEVLEFNAALEQRGTKGEVNAWAIGRFLAWLWRQPDRRRSEAWSDRLGGRQRYGPLLAPLFPAARFSILEQEQASQAYRVEEREGRRSLEIHFEKEGEDKSFTTALASMTAKYVRELHMSLFNRWWQEQLPGLKRTAGYPQDARRFLAEIEQTRRDLEIPLNRLVRHR
ncbi:MAG: hypothetical protein ACO4BJ_11800 [Planctomycetota bacterium]